MNEVTGLTRDRHGNFVRGPARENRENFINRPRRNRRNKGAKKHVLVSTWEPRNPDIGKILKKNINTLYRDPINRRLYPKGSVIAGFRKRRNLGEMIAPTKPRRVPRPPPGGDPGCGPCDASRCQVHKNLITTDTVVSPWDNRTRKIRKPLNCKVKNIVYYLKCGSHGAHYCGSSVDFRARWRNHISDMRKGKGDDCNFCEHWSRCHKEALTDLSPIQIFFVDSCEDPGSKADGYPLLRKLEDRWMVQMGSLGTFDPINGCNRKDDAKAKSYGSG